MKSFNHLYEVCISKENRLKSVHKALQGRKGRRKVRRYASDEKKAAEMALKWVTGFRRFQHDYVEIYDGLSRKKRKIIIPTFEELTVQHCVVNALMPVFTCGLYSHAYGSIPGRGAHRAKKYIEKWIRTDKRNVKYVLKMDIRHFFDSIPHDVIKRKLTERIHDEQMLNLVFEIIDTTDEGLPLGFYTSQWLSMWYLTELDHYIKETLKAKYYVRYVDDMVIFGSNKRELHRMRAAIDGYLRDNLGLKLKGNWQVFRFNYMKNGKHRGRDLDFMGFRFYRDRTTLRRSIMLKATRKAAKISKKGYVTAYDAKQFLSYMGYISHTDTYGMYLKWIKPKVRIRRLKKKVSREAKRKERLTCGRQLKAA